MFSDLIKLQYLFLGFYVTNQCKVINNSQVEGIFLFLTQKLQHTCICCTQIRTGFINTKFSWNTPQIWPEDREYNQKTRMQTQARSWSDHVKLKSFKSISKTVCPQS